MATAYFWCLCFLHHGKIEIVWMKRIAIVLLVTLLSLGLKAQFNINELGSKTIYFGIAMGFNVGDFKLIHTPAAPQNDSVRYMKTTIGPGFNLGIIGNYQFHKYF